LLLERQNEGKKTEIEFEKRRQVEIGSKGEGEERIIIDVPAKHHHSTIQNKQQQNKKTTKKGDRRLRMEREKGEGPSSLETRGG
jgi:hypothetical protein